MLNEILKFDGVVKLNQDQQKKVTGGEGPYVAICESGARIEELPDTNQDTLDHACYNQGGSTGWICSGSEC